MADPSDAPTFDVPLEDLARARIGLARALAEGDQEPAELDRIISDCLAVECLSCDIRLKKGELDLLACPRTPAEEINPKVRRLRQGYCARTGCDSRFYGVRVTRGFSRDWEAVFRRARAAASAHDVEPRAEQDESLASSRHPLNRRRVVLLGLLCAGTMAGCDLSPEPQVGLEDVKREIRAKYASAPTISTDELSEWMQATEQDPPLILDVREEEEFRVSHIRGAQHAPTLEAAAEAVSRQTREDRIVLYCSVGYRSARLIARLREQGCTNAYNLEGSIFQWANEGRPVYRGGRIVRAVHPFDETWGRYLDRALWSFSAEEGVPRKGDADRPGKPPPHGTVP